MSKIDLHKIKKVHFIGIGGIGISALARMMALEGKEVTANDLDEFEMVTTLRQFGINTTIGTNISDVPVDAELIVYSVAWDTIAPKLLKAVRERGVPLLSYAEVLGLISEQKFTIAIAGSHGKTTTTAMVAHILIEAGLDPTVIVGSVFRDPRNGAKSNFIAGKSKYFVVEACEYKRSFLNIHPNIAIVTNIDDDHLDYYKNLEGVQQGFKEFLGQIKKGGTVVTDIEGEKIVPVLEQSEKFLNEREIVSLDYLSLEQADGHGKISLKIPGEHNIKNAKAALVVASVLGIPKEKAIESLASFSGTWRRFEEKGKTKTGALVYDDYGHHPSEITATLRGARDKFPGQKIVVAFQPHLYSRTREHFDEFGPALGLADEILILPIYAAREPADPEVTSEILTEKVQKVLDSKKTANFFADFELAAEHLKNNLKSGDVFFTMGAGDVGKIAEMVLEG